MRLKRIPQAILSQTEDAYTIPRVFFFFCSVKHFAHISSAHTFTYSEKMMKKIIIKYVFFCCSNKILSLYWAIDGGGSDVDMCLCVT